MTMNESPDEMTLAVAADRRSLHKTAAAAAARGKRLAKAERDKIRERVDVAAPVVERTKHDLVREAEEHMAIAEKAEAAGDDERAAYHYELAAYQFGASDTAPDRAEDPT